MDAIGSLRTVFVVSRAFGLTPFKFDESNVAPSRGSLYFSRVFFGITVVVLFSQLVQEALEEIRNLQEPIWSTARILNLLAFLLCSFQMVLSVAFKANHMCEGLNLINKLLKLLRVSSYKELNAFGRKFLFFNLFIYTLCLIHGLLVNLWYYKGGVGRMTRFAFFFTYLLLTNVYATLFVVLIRVLRFAYDGIHKILLADCKGGNLKLLEEIKKIRQHDLSMKAFVRILDLVFIRFILFYIVWIFTIIVHGTMWVIQADSSPLNLLLWMIYYYTQITFILSACYMCSLKAEKTANYLHELFIDNDDPDLKEEIEIFSLQLLHRKVEFNACGFFKLDFSLLYSMVGAVTTYIIILMQFQGNHGAGYGQCSINCTNCSAV